MMERQVEFLDFITIVSFLVSLENLSLNQQQTDNLDKHLKKQDIDVRVELNKIIKQNEEIIKMIKEEINYAQKDAKRSNR